MSKVERSAELPGDAPSQEIAFNIVIFQAGDAEDEPGEPRRQALKDEEKWLEIQGIAATKSSDGGEPEDQEVRDIINRYIGDIKGYPLLTREQEKELARQIEGGREASARLGEAGLSEEERDRLKRQAEAGREAFDEFVLSNTRLVISIAKRYTGRGVPLLDLIQEGNLGLMRAVERFDWRRGLKFSTYGTWWIRQAVQRGIADQGRTIRLPAHIGERLIQIDRRKRGLAQDLGREPTLKELSSETGKDEETLEWYMRISRRTLSLEQPVGEDGKVSLGELIEDEGAVPDEDASRRLLESEIAELLRSLTAREARILILRYGLADGRTRTLEEVGANFGLTKERIRQIEQEALRKLRHPVRTRELRDFLR